MTEERNAAGQQTAAAGTPETGTPMLAPGNTAIGDEVPDSGDLTELLQELRVLIPGVQVLTGFLVILPFSQGFARIPNAERWVYLAAFICVLISLILFTAPAAQHRLERPLRDRARFKQFATGMTIAGLIPLSLSLVLTTQLVVSQTIGYGTALAVSLVVAALIGGVWWAWPLEARRQARRAH
jgi:hypothetical protein